MGKKQTIVTTALWGIVVSVMLAMLATRSMRAHADEDKFSPLFDVPDFALVNQDGKTVSSADLRGNVWIADFIFTHCAGPCPMMTAKMAELQKRMNRPDVKLVSFSVDPERDTPDVLKTYAEKYNPDPSRWSFLTGTRAQLFSVVQGMKIAAEKEDDGSVTHSTQFGLIDRGGHVCGIYSATDPTGFDRLVADASDLAAKN